jgi:myo-inositol 2-dehydrogenase / D-chiro-inositol 1-dehydrogenase
MASPTRRKFIQSSTLAATAGGVLLSSATPVHAAGSDVLKVGLVGTGGRGSGAAVNALVGDPNCKLVALCDIFPDRIESGLKAIVATAQDEEKRRKRDDIVKRIDVKDEMRFDGFDGYKKLIDSGVDVVLLCSTPGFRPIHLAYAVEKKKDVFMEKPHATDVAGLKSVLDSVKAQKANGKSLVSGFTYRYHAPKRETMKRVLDGAIGDVHNIYCSYLTGELWYRGNSPKWSQMEQQIRNWYYYIWLSGDFIVEQNIHTIDKAAWLMGGALPVSAIGSGGRQSRTDDKFGNIWDNFSVVFEYESGAKVVNQCRQVSGCLTEQLDLAYGTKGTCDLKKHTIVADGKTWTTKDVPLSEAYQTEHDELFAAVRSGKPINDGEVSAHSTLMSILGREAAYTGKRITWKQLLDSNQNLMPKAFEFGNLAMPDVPVPGQYKLGNGKV